MWLQNVRDRESNSRSNPRSRKGSRTVGKSIAMGKRSFGGSYVSRKRNKAGYKPYKKKLVFHGPSVLVVWVMLVKQVTNFF